MTKEQEAIEYLKESVLIYKNTIPKISKAIEIVLSMLKHNSAEIEQKNTELAEKNAEIENKDKIINEMAKYIDSNNYVDSEECQFQWDFNIKKCIENGDCKDCIKQYFENKVNSSEQN